jgi:hypothetical protein
MRTLGERSENVFQSIEQQLMKTLDTEPENRPQRPKVVFEKTEVDKERALAMHKLNGLQKGDLIVVSQDNFAGGATLFPIVMAETTREERKEGEGEGKATTVVTAQATHLTRYLVVTPERLMLLQMLTEEEEEEMKRQKEQEEKEEKEGEEQEEQGEKEQQEEQQEEQEEGERHPRALVLGNHHLTELTKLTFSKKNHALVTLYLRTGMEEDPFVQMKFLVKKRSQFVELLQNHMLKFK